jgi:hypothetical protein
LQAQRDGWTEAAQDYDWDKKAVRWVGGGEVVCWDWNDFTWGGVSVLGGVPRCRRQPGARRPVSTVLAEQEYLCVVVDHQQDAMEPDDSDSDSDSDGASDEEGGEDGSEQFEGGEGGKKKGRGPAVPAGICHAAVAALAITAEGLQAAVAAKAAGRARLEAARSAEREAADAAAAAVLAEEKRKHDEYLEYERERAEQEAGLRTAQGGVGQSELRPRSQSSAARDRARLRDLQEGGGLTFAFAQDQQSQRELTERTRRQAGREGEEHARREKLAAAERERAEGRERREALAAGAGGAVAGATVVPEGPEGPPPPRAEAEWDAEALRRKPDFDAITRRLMAGDASAEAEFHQQWSDDLKVNGRGGAGAAVPDRRRGAFLPLCCVWSGRGQAVTFSPPKTARSPYSHRRPPPSSRRSLARPPPPATPLSLP